MCHRTIYGPIWLAGVLRIIDSSRLIPSPSRAPARVIHSARRHFREVLGGGWKFVASSRIYSRVHLRVRIVHSQSEVGCTRNPRRERVLADRDVEAASEIRGITGLNVGRDTTMGLLAGTR